ncbi:MAG: hypothetical protein AAGE59_28355 [Cyanobacteria bacterium P01_F01_bin.86]
MQLKAHKVVQMVILALTTVTLTGLSGVAAPRGAILDDENTVYGDGGSTTIACLHNSEYWYIDLTFISADGPLASVQGTVITTAGNQHGFVSLINPPNHRVDESIQIPRSEVGEGTFVAEVTGIAVSVGPLKRILPASCEITF